MPLGLCPHGAPTSGAASFGTPAALEPPSPTVVLIPGFGGVESLDYWKLDSLHRAFPRARFVPVFPGPFSSHHDRACEIFYMLKGGRVDYGEEHAARFGHDRFGRLHSKALLPGDAWAAECPVILLGHSMGGITARVLQQYLHDRAFPGHDTSAAWVSVVATLSSPHNGDPVVHALGSRAPAPIGADGGASPEVGGRQSRTPMTSLVRFASLGYFIGVLIHVIAFVDMPGVLPDLRLDQWALSRRHGRRWRPFWRSVSHLLRAFANRSCMVEGEDNLAHDCTEFAMEEWNARLVNFPSTLYLSFVAERPYGVPLCRSLLMLLSFAPLGAVYLITRAVSCMVGDLLARCSHGGSAGGGPRGRKKSERGGGPAHDVQDAEVGAGVLIVKPTPATVSAAVAVQAGAPKKAAAINCASAVHVAPVRSAGRRLLNHRPSDGLLRCTSQEAPSGAFAEQMHLPTEVRKAYLGSGLHYKDHADMRAAAADIRADVRSKAPQLVLPLGVWVVSKLCDCDHFGVVPFPIAGDEPVAFFDLLLAMAESCAAALSRSSCAWKH